MVSIAFTGLLALWLLASAAMHFHRLDDVPELVFIRQILMLGFLVSIPLAGYAQTRDPKPELRAMARQLRVLWPLAGLAASYGLFFRTGMIAATWCLPALCVGALSLAYGLRRFLLTPAQERRSFHADLALGLLPVAVAWLMVAISGGSFLGFGGKQALLTANHFIYAGFCSGWLVTAADRAQVVGREEPSILRNAAHLGLGPGVLLLAVGIATSRWLEMPAAWLVAAGLLAQALRHLWLARHWRPVGPRIAMLASGLAAFLPALLAAQFAFRGFAWLNQGSLRRMLDYHAIFLALGFCSLGLWAHLMRASGAEDAAASDEPAAANE